MHISDPTGSGTTELDVRFIQNDEHWKLEQLVKILVSQDASIRIVRRSQEDKLWLVFLDSLLDRIDINLKMRRVETGNIDDDTTCT